MKPTKEMLKQADVLKKCASFIDEKQTYKMKIPYGSVMEFSGSELIRTGEAFAELLAAGESGDDEKMRRALQRVAAIDCDG